MNDNRTSPNASESPETAEAQAVMPDGAAAAVSRRSVLKGIGVGAATVVVAGTGVLSYRVFDNGVLDAGSGKPYDAWSHWRDYPGPLGTVAAAILAANPQLRAMRSIRRCGVTTVAALPRMRRRPRRSARP